MTYWDIANSSLLWGLVSLGLLYVLVLSAVFALKGSKRCTDLGIDKSVIKKVVVSSATFSIIPSLSIVIGLISLATVLGPAWSWFRLSVVGSVGYETMAADMAAKSLGAESLAAVKNEPAVIMGAVMIVMSIGILSGNIVNIFFAKKISTSINSYNQKSGGWGTLFTSCFMLTMIGVMAVVQISNGIPYFLTLAVGFVVTFALGKVAQTFKLAWLDNFTLSIAMVAGMASSVLWHNLFM